MAMMRFARLLEASSALKVGAMRSKRGIEKFTLIIIPSGPMKR
jgi:hypothetical protein